MKTIWGTVPRIIAIGDLHGDWNALVRCLKLAKVVDRRGNWIGGKTHLVQVGDILDRANRGSSRRDENSEFKIYGYLAELGEQAIRAGGYVHFIIGNHELMNIEGDFSYVSPLGIKAFGGPQGRKMALRPGSEFARFLADHATPALRIGTILFAHAGPTPAVVDRYTVSSAKTRINQYLRGHAPFPDDMSDLFWTRLYSDPNSPQGEASRALSYSLSKWNARYLVVGHTVQDRINAGFGGRVYRVDTGASGAFSGPKGKAGRTQVLEIINGKIFNTIG